MNRRSCPLVVPAVAAGLLALTGCKGELYSGLSQQEANAMVLVLQLHGVATSKQAAKDGGQSILVDDAKLAEAISVLSEAGFPRKKFETMGDVFKPGGLVPSPMEERARFLYAVDQELSAAISQIDGVLSAQVEVVLPQNDLLARASTPSSASVLVRYEANSGVDRLVPQLKSLVAGSVEGLQYERVSVVLIPVTPRTLSVATPAAPVKSAGLATLALAALAGGLAVGGVGALVLTLRRSRRSSSTPAIEGAGIGALEGPVT